MGSDMVRTTMEPCTAHCFIACEPVGAKNFALDSGWTTSGTPQKHVDNKIGRILPVQKFGQLDRIGHWPMATAQGRLHIFLLILATFTVSLCQRRLCPNWARQPARRPKTKSKKGSQTRCCICGNVGPKLAVSVWARSVCVGHDGRASQDVR